MYRENVLATMVFTSKAQKSQPARDAGDSCCSMTAMLGLVISNNSQVEKTEKQNY
jgi:hypothetical protein